jgi:RNA polymerase sigma factor (sigma-70 family)
VDGELRRATSWLGSAVTPDDVARGEFERMYRATCEPLLAYLMRRAPDTQDAADLLSDVFLVAWRRRDCLPPDDEQRPWLFGIARKLLANHRRRIDRADGLTDTLATALARRVLPPDPYGHSAMLRAALALLGADDRELLMLAAWEGLAPAEIALATGRPAGTVRVRLHRARARLRRALQEIETGDVSEEPATHPMPEPSLP